MWRQIDVKHSGIGNTLKRLNIGRHMDSHIDRQAYGQIDILTATQTWGRIDIWTKLYIHIDKHMDIGQSHRHTERMKYGQPGRQAYRQIDI